MTYPSDVERARIRARVGSAARVVSATWPLRTFVAVNPLGGLEDRPIEEAVRLAGGLLGLRGRPSLEAFRSWYAEGRITDADLDAALLRHVPGIELLPDVHIGGRHIAPVEVLRHELLNAEEEPPAVTVPRGAAEWCDRLLGTGAAAVVDEQVGKWCAAFCDTRRGRLSMPGRERGLYLAWRDLVRDDPALRRLGLSPVHFRDLPQRPEDAILAGLAALRIPEREHRAELRAQLARLPGFASHIKWREEHPDQALHPADLTEFLAIRLTYEAAVVSAATDGRLDTGNAGLRALVEEQLMDSDVSSERLPVGVASEARADCVQLELTGAELGHARSADVDLARAARLVAKLGADAVTSDDLQALATLLERLPGDALGWVWLDAYEWHYRDRLLAQLSRPASTVRSGRPAAQAVFCIDARSEGIRRHLEARGGYETFGFAGFYQLVIRYQALQSSRADRLCPVPLTPTKTVIEHPAEGCERPAARDVAVQRHAAALNHAFHHAKDDLAAAFALAEVGGWAAGPLAATKTLAPRSYGRAREWLIARVTRRQTQTTVSAFTPDDAEHFVAQTERQMIRAFLDRPGLSDEECEALRHRALTGGEPGLADALDLSSAGHQRRLGHAQSLGYEAHEQLDWAEFALRSFALVEGFARVVLLAGHGSRTENNAYEAALDCGACGGQRGGPNARIACAMLNRPELRAGLVQRGITIPADTLFVAAEHDTASDRVRILDRHLVPESHRQDVDRLQSDLDAAGAALAAERARRLPGTQLPQSRARDWAQVRPEWGLARHAAFIVGPGEMVSGLDLECRTFLHSYDWSADPDGSVLETILTAPGLVVQWINAQYYFATTDPAALGAGDKTLHNVIGDVGVIQGHAGDLRLGLPWQSVAAGSKLYHEPMRVLFVVQAPAARVQMLIERNDLLRHYLDGGWVTLVARDSPEDPWKRRTRAGAWKIWHPATTQGHPATTQTMEAVG